MTDDALVSDHARWDHKVEAGARATARAMAKVRVRVRGICVSIQTDYVEDSLDDGRRYRWCPTTNELD